MNKCLFLEISDILSNFHIFLHNLIKSALYKAELLKNVSQNLKNAEIKFIKNLLRNSNHVKVWVLHER